MAAAPQVSEYEVVERPRQDKIFAFVSGRVVLEFATAMSSGSLWVGVGLRVRTSSGNLRPPDIIAYEAEPPARVPENAALVTIEIIAADELFCDVFEKGEEYRRWGIQNIWTVEPPQRRLNVYRDGHLHAQPELSLPEFGVHIKAESLFAQLPK